MTSILSSSLDARTPGARAYTCASRGATAHAHVRHWRSLALFVAVGLVATVCPALSARAGGAWDNPSAIPNAASLNLGGSATIDALSCSSVGYCSAIGDYASSSTTSQVFVATETNGTWGPAVAVPYYSTLNQKGAVVQPLVISCSAPGDCSFGGGYTDTLGAVHGFLGIELNGQVGDAWSIPLPSTSSSTDLGSTVLTLSCPSNTFCSAGGLYQDSANHTQAFVANEINGSWRSPIEVPGSQTLNAGDTAFITSMSCPSLGDCTASGAYTDASKNEVPFIVTANNATWGNATELSGVAALGTASKVVPNDVSCPIASACTMVGTYTDASGKTQSFTADASVGVWGAVTPVTSATTGLTSSSLASVSCSSPGNCLAGGQYVDTAGHLNALVDGEVNGQWKGEHQLVITVPSTLGSDSSVVSVACVANLSCEAAGYYFDQYNEIQAFVADDASSTGLANFHEVLATSALNVGGVSIATTLSCAPDGSCALGGNYEDISTNLQAFAVDSAAIFTVPGPPGVRILDVNKTHLILVLNGGSYDGGSPITQWQYSLNGGPWKTVHWIQFGYTAIAGKPGVTYRMVVRAVNAVGVGANSVVMTAKIPGPRRIHRRK